MMWDNGRDDASWAKLSRDGRRWHSLAGHAIDAGIVFETP